MTRNRLSTIAITTGLLAIAALAGTSLDSGSGQEVAARYHLRTRTSRFFDRATNSGRQATPATPQIRERQIQSGQEVKSRPDVRSHFCA